MEITIQNEDFTNMLTEKVVRLLVPTLQNEVIKAINDTDEILTAEQIWRRCFPCYKKIETCRSHWLNRKDFPKIKRGNKTYYSLKQVNEYLKTAK